MNIHKKDWTITVSNFKLDKELYIKRRSAELRAEGYDDAVVDTIAALWRSVDGFDKAALTIDNMDNYDQLTRLKPCDSVNDLGLHGGAGGAVVIVSAILISEEQRTEDGGRTGEFHVGHVRCE